jgi:hypothetical protein
MIARIESNCATSIKRYVVTALDKESKFAFAYAYKNHSSDGTTDFMKKFILKILRLPSQIKISKLC